MTTITAAGRLLTASIGDRILSYLLLPFGEEGRTSAGRVTAAAGSVTIPDTHVVANLEHDRTTPAAVSTVIEETPAGLTASFRVLPTSVGDDLLVEASEGVRTGISVEIDNPVIRDGQLLAGVLSGAGFVTAPAFPSAQLVAADAGDLPDELPPDSDEHSESTSVIVIDGVEYVRKTTSTYTTETTPKGDTEPDSGEDESETTEETPVTARTTKTAPASLLARRGTAKTQQPTTGHTHRDIARVLASAFANNDASLLASIGDQLRGVSTLFAALSDVKYDGTGGLAPTITLPDWLGLLWSGKKYERKIVPLFSHGDLTSLTMKGWKWGTKPVMATWAGNKANVPSGPVTVEPYEKKASRYAGGHDHAREYRDFDTPEYWEGYFEAMTESYARLTDEATAVDVIAAATAVPSGTVPAGVAPGLVKVVDGALSMLDVATPTFALLHPALWREVLLTPTDKALEYLSSSLGMESGSLDGFRLIPWAGLSAGSVLVGAREAATVKELPGVPIRVEGLDLVKGGIDTALFGYAGTVIEEPKALALVDGPTGG